MEEKWLPIPFNQYYSVSNLGRVRSDRYDRILTPRSTSKKDLHQKVSIQGKTYFVHRLVMLAFNPCPNAEQLQVNHKDGNPLNNKLENLEWMTEKENHNHYKEKLIPQRRKEDNFNLGAKKKNIKVTFPDFVNYYIGIEDACQNLNISKSTFLKWKNDISLTKGRIISIEYIDSLPESFTNFEVKIEKTSIPKKVRILFFDGRVEEYDTCKEADLSIGLPIGTV